MSRAAYEREINLSKQSQEESLQNPDGVSYMGQLWELVEDQNLPLTVVMRTDEEVFSDVPVTAQWRSGRYHWQSSDSKLGSELVFEVPEEVTRRVQSHNIQTVLRRWFGQRQTVDLEEAFLPPRTEIISYRASEWERNVREESILNDWDTLKEAIRLTAGDSSGYLGGQPVEAWGPRRAHVVPAQIAEDRLELHLTKAVIGDMHAAWSRAFRREVLLDEPSRY